MTRPDPGGHFASDDHRRVMAALPNPDEDPMLVETLHFDRVEADDFLDLDAEEVAEILKDLEAEGQAKQTKAGWKNTPSGFKTLTGPNKET